MKGSLRLLCCLCVLILASQASAQMKCKVEYYSTEHGLSHRAITSMVKDREGFMWFGSWDGINRFDGHRFVSYKSSPGDQSQLGSDRIDQILEDQAGYLWIQAYNSQVYRFDKSSEEYLPISSFIQSRNGQPVRFTSVISASNGWVWLRSDQDGLFAVSQSDLSRFHQYEKGLPADFRLPSNTINFFYEDDQHRIWIGTPKGLCCLEPDAKGVYRNAPALASGLFAGVAFTAFSEDKTFVFFSTANGRLVLFDKNSKQFSVHEVSKAKLNAVLRSKKKDILYCTTSDGELITFDLRTQTTSIAKYPTGETLGNIYEDRSGAVWLEPQTIGVIRYSPFQKAFQSFVEKVEDPSNVIGYRYKVFEDADGNVWVNMKKGGFGYYNSSTSSMEFNLTADGSSFRLPAVVYALYYDPVGILWLRVHGRELVKIVFQKNEFRQQQFVNTGAALVENEIRGLMQDRQGRLWIGAKSGKLYVRHHDKDVKGLLVNEPPEGLGQVYSMLQDKHGNIWFATKRHGIYRAKPVNKEQTKYWLTNYKADNNSPDSLTSNQIYALLEDEQDRMWVGTFDRGLLYIENGNDAVRFVHAGDAFVNYPKDGFQKIRHMAFDAKHNIWIATTNGLVILDANIKQSQAYNYKTYCKIAGNIESLGNNDVQFIYCDASNRMWLTTSGGGFCRAFGEQPFESLKFRNYTTHDGLPNDYVLSCAEDASGNLWFATENGLSRFTPSTHAFRNYDTYDGLPKVGFSEAAACRLANGELVFGTTQGVLSFHSDRINANRIVGNIAFTNIQINNEDAGPDTKEGILKTDINYISELKLQYNQNIISIDYSILDHRAGNRQAFAYRLLGFDTTWHDDRQQRRAIYTNLPPGSYVFEVKNLTGDLYLNAPYKKLAITILPPPWKTWWAYALYILFIGTVLYFIRRYALAMIRLRHKIAVEQKLAALKMNFFTNVSHELRTPLTLIVSPLEQVAQKATLSPELHSYVEIARKNADRMIRFVNQLLDLRKVQSEKAELRMSRVEVVSFVKKIVEHFTEAASAKQLRLEVLSEQRELMAWVDAEKLDVVIYNLVGNAVKFTPTGKTITILVNAIPTEEQFYIAVKDEGPGVPKAQLENIFELFQEGDHANGSDWKGTGIGLALSREFVNLHGGKIWAENNEQGGLTVTVKLKLNAARNFAEPVKAIPVANELSAKQLVSQFAGNGSLQDQQVPLVLLVEDNDDLRSFVRDQLSSSYRVETASNGEEGLQKAITLIPDLIISDIMMPKMNGIQLLDNIKNELTTSHIPFVLLSAKYSIESQLEGLKYGADCYITKPFNNEFLIASIGNLLRQRRKLFEALLDKKQTVKLHQGPVITSKDEHFLKRVILVVEEKMGDSNFNIDVVAESIAMSHKTFSRKLKSLTGLTPVEFVRDMRLQRAKQLLDAGGGNISEVAYEVGFSNPKYFSTCFKEKHQVSPSDYVKAKEL